MRGFTLFISSVTHGQFDGLRVGPSIKNDFNFILFLHPDGMPDCTLPIKFPHCTFSLKFYTFYSFLHREAHAQLALSHAQLDANLSTLIINELTYVDNLRRYFYLNIYLCHIK